MSSSAEADYVIVKDGIIYPIEVKSGPSGKLRSLHIFLDEHPELKTGLVMSPVVFSKQKVEKLFFMPVYSTFEELNKNVLG